MLNAYGRRGRWISMFQDFNFKIVYCVGSRHGDVDALNRNPIGNVDEDKDFHKDIQDYNWMQQVQRVEVSWYGRRSSKMELILQQLNNKVVIN
jgi:hypothetical protein